MQRKSPGRIYNNVNLNRDTKYNTAVDITYDNNISILSPENINEKLINRNYINKNSSPHNSCQSEKIAKKLWGRNNKLNTSIHSDKASLSRKKEQNESTKKALSFERFLKDKKQTIKNETEQDYSNPVESILENWHTKKNHKNDPAYNLQKEEIYTSKNSAIENKNTSEYNIDQLSENNSIIYEESNSKQQQNENFKQDPTLKFSKENLPTRRNKKYTKKGDVTVISVEYESNRNPSFYKKTIDNPNHQDNNPFHNDPFKKPNFSQCIEKKESLSRDSVKKHKNLSCMNPFINKNQGRSLHFSVDSFSKKSPRNHKQLHKNNAMEIEVNSQNRIVDVILQIDQPNDEDLNKSRKVLNDRANHREVIRSPKKSSKKEFSLSCNKVFKEDYKIIEKAENNAHYNGKRVICNTSLEERQATKKSEILDFSGTKSNVVSSSTVQNSKKGKENEQIRTSINKNSSAVIENDLNKNSSTAIDNGLNKISNNNVENDLNESYNLYKEKLASELNFSFVEWMPDKRIMKILEKMKRLHKTNDGNYKSLFDEIETKLEDISESVEMERNRFLCILFYMEKFLSESKFQIDTKRQLFTMKNNALIESNLKIDLDEWDENDKQQRWDELEKINRNLKSKKSSFEDINKLGHNIHSKKSSYREIDKISSDLHSPRNSHENFFNIEEATAPRCQVEDYENIYLDDKMEMFDNFLKERAITLGEIQDLEQNVKRKNFRFTNDVIKKYNNPGFKSIYKNTEGDIRGAYKEARKPNRSVEKRASSVYTPNKTNSFKSKTRQNSKERFLIDIADESQKNPLTKLPLNKEAAIKNSTETKKFIIGFKEKKYEMATTVETSKKILNKFKPHLVRSVYNKSYLNAKTNTSQNNSQVHNNRTNTSLNNSQVRTSKLKNMKIKTMYTQDSEQQNSFTSVTPENNLFQVPHTTKNASLENSVKKIELKFDEISKIFGEKKVKKYKAQNQTHLIEPRRLIKNNSLLNTDMFTSSGNIYSTLEENRNNYHGFN